MDMFLRKYQRRINSINSWKTLNEWFALYTEKGEVAFLDELEEQEDYTDFCEKYYDGLRTLYNICSAGMWDYYQMYKVKFGGDEMAFRNELRLRIKNFDRYF